MKNSIKHLVILCVLLCVNLANLAFGETIELSKDAKTKRVIVVEVVETPALANKSILPTPVASPSPSPSVSPTPGASDAVTSARLFLDKHGKAFGSRNPARDFALMKVNRDNLNMTHVRYQQVRNIPGLGAVPVLGGETIVHVSKDGIARLANGHFADWIKNAGKYKLSRTAAISRAKKSWYIQYGTNNTPSPVSVLPYIVAPGLLNHDNDTSSYLTYQVEISGSVPFTREFYYIDATSGELRFQQSGIRRLYRKIYDCTAKPESGGCWSNYTNPVTGYHHGRWEGQSSWGPNPIYNAYDVDILYEHFGNLHEYLLVKFGRNGANGQGGLGNGSTQPVGYTTGNTYLDLMSTWENLCPGASFDAGVGTVGFCYNSVSADVVAHEYMHGLVWYTHPPYGMTYWGETGALEESQSDVWGELYEIYLNGSTNWFHWPDRSTGPVRSLVDPGSVLNIHLQPANAYYPDRFYDTNVYCGSLDSQGVHFNSTIPSKAAYLMAVGGSFNGCTIQPIGHERLEQILYRAVTNYYSNSESFSSAYYAQVNACKDLYGSSSETCNSVARALQAVEMDQPGKCSGIPSKEPTCKDLVVNCVDSDGEDAFTSGTVTFDGVERKDTCIFGNVIENVCVDDQWKTILVSCEQGCVEGACV